LGYKVWSKNSSLGYCIQLDPYQGHTSNDNKGLGLGASVVLHLSSTLPEIQTGRQYNLFFDNFFTSFSLLNMLSDKSFGATETVRVNRIEKCPLKSVDTLKKEPCGSCDYRLDKTTGILVARWNDNSVVTIASNKFGVQPFRQAQR